METRELFSMHWSFFSFQTFQDLACTCSDNSCAHLFQLNQKIDLRNGKIFIKRHHTAVGEYIYLNLKLKKTVQRYNVLFEKSVTIPEIAKIPVYEACLNAHPSGKLLHHGS